MKTLPIVSLALVATLLLLTGCGEKPQVMGQAKPGVAAFQGVGSSPFAQPGWTAGDRGSWEQHLKARANYSQNDFARMGE